MQAQEIKDLIVAYCEGATNNVADGVLYNELAEAIVEKFTSTNSAMDAIELLVEVVNAFSGDTGSNYSMRLLGVMDRARDFVVAQQHQ